MTTTTIFGRGICTGCGHDIALNQNGTVRRHRTPADVWCAGSRKEPKPVLPADPRRAQWVADARALIDLIEANPALPLPSFGLQVHAFANSGADDEADRATVDATAAALGTEAVTTPYGAHYQVAVTIGDAAYELTAIPQRTKRRHKDTWRLGEAALAAVEQEAAA